MSASRVSRPKIDYDILVAIMQFMEGPYGAQKKTISVLSRTCRYLHSEGVKSLLAHGVVIATPHAASFGRFVLADPTMRGPLLRSLQIRIREADQATLDLFLGCLRHAVCLTQLRLDSLEELPGVTAKRLCATIQSLTSVEDLTLYYEGGALDRRLLCDPSSTREEYFPEFLRQLQSPVISVSLQLPPMYDNAACTIYTRDRDPIFLLSSLQTSLVQVALSGNITVGGGKCVYPRVTRLSLPQTFEWGLPLLQPYIASFPNMTTLGILYDMISREDKDVDVLTLRRSGIQLQEWHRINTRNQDASGTWPRIDSLRATTVDAYVYAVSSQITRLHLLTIGGKHSVELAMLSSILARTLPTVLRLSVKVWSGRNSLPIVPPTSAVNDYLSSLEIRINVILHEFDPEPYIDHLAGVLRSMRALESFRLEFRCLNTECRHLETNEVPRTGTVPVNGSGIYCHSLCSGEGRSRCYLQEIMEHADLYRQVRSFMVAAPALRRATLMWKRSHFFRRDAPPDRVVSIDLDRLPHSVDRRGNETDAWLEGDW